MTERRLEPSGDPGHGVPSGPWEPPAMPADAQRIGLNRNTVEGAWLEFAGQLDRRRPLHVVVAWLALAIFVAPVVLSVLDLLDRIFS